MPDKAPSPPPHAMLAFQHAAWLLQSMGIANAVNIAGNVLKIVAEQDATTATPEAAAMIEMARRAMAVMSAEPPRVVLAAADATVNGKKLA